MLTVAVHEQHGAAPGMVQSRHQGGFLAEIARQRHHLNVERIGGKPARDAERRVRAAVIDIDDLAGEAVALPQRLCPSAKPLVQKCQPGGLVVQRARRSTAPAPRRWPRWLTGPKRPYPASSIRFQPSERQHMVIALRCRHGDATSACASLPQECLKPGEQRIVAVEHIVERRHRNRVGAVGAKEAAERVKLRRRAVQRDHSRRGRPAERRDHAEAIMGLRQAAPRRIRQSGCGLPGTCWRARGRRCDRG